MSIIVPNAKILAIDPGRTTGFASWGPSEAYIRAWQLAMTEVDNPYDSFLNELVEFYPDVVVYEGFDHRQKDSIDYTPVELIGLIKWFCERRHILAYKQTASYGKSYFDNTKLKKLKLYIPGQPHAMDARRHLMQFRMKYGHFDVKELK